MATRSHIRFVEGDKSQQLFKFHDGDIQYMKDHFAEFFSLCRNMDFDEIVPSFITFTKMNHRKEMTIGEFLTSEWNELNLEVYLTDRIEPENLPDDIEYFYIVDLDKKEITEILSEGETWKIEEQHNGLEVVN